MIVAFPDHTHLLFVSVEHAKDFITLGLVSDKQKDETIRRSKLYVVCVQHS